MKKSELKIPNINKNLKKYFDKIKEEFEEHLDTINANTNEIHSNYEYLCELDSKMDKLNEKLDETLMFIQHLTNKPVKKYKKTFKIAPLTRREKEIFLALYTLEQNKEPVTYTKIAEFLALTTFIVQNYITNLIEKGIPIQKSYNQKGVFIRINPEFRELQAKNNIVGINEPLSKRVQRQ